jgi:hypothetical protein
MITLPSWSPIPDLRVLDLALAAFLVFYVIERGGLTIPGWHTVSYLAHDNLWIRATLTLAILVSAGWFWIHTGHHIPR